MFLDIIAEDKSLITYRPSLNKLTGSITATILLQQILYWWKASQGEFYKFKEPCKHKDYKEGDSWTEELGMTKYEFDSAFKKLRDLGFITTRNTMDRKTYYSVNEEVLTEKLNELYTPCTPKLKKPIYVSGKNQSSIYTETTRDYKKENKKNNYYENLPSPDAHIMEDTLDYINKIQEESNKYSEEQRKANMELVKQTISKIKQNNVVNRTNTD